MTLEEALEASGAEPVNDIFQINPENRTITVPESERIFGVSHDGNTERKHFRCQKIVGDNIDLSTMHLYINYQNANGQKYPYLVEDVQTDGDYITFSWLIGPDVVAYKGQVKFIVCGKKGDRAIPEWNTTLAEGTVLEGLEATDEVVDRNPDIITQLLARMHEVEKIATKEEMQEYVNTYLTEHPGEIDETLTDPKKAAPADIVGLLKEDLVGVMHHDSVKKIYKKLDVDFTNGTVGMLNSADTIDATKTDYIVSDYISLDGVRKIYRYGITNKYNFESYCLYDSNKNAIDNGFHARTTNYTFEEYDGRSDVANYDISLIGAKYIRITKDNTIPNYSYVMEKENGCVYALKNDIHTPNIDENTEKITKIDSKVAMISDERLIAKSFIKFRSDRDIVYDNTYINTENGVVYNGDAYSSYKSSDYIPIDNTKKYNTAFCSRINFYDENRKWLYGQLAYGNKTGSGRMYKIEIQDERVAHARLTYSPSNNEPYCGLAEEQDNYEVLNLGDSIFGINPVCFDISSIAQEKTGYRFANCGFGGSQASSYPDETSPFYSFNFWKIADAIDSGDFSEQIASAEKIYTSGDASILYQNRIDILTSVDFSKLKLITIGYGTNDFSKSIALDSTENKKDVTTYCGALRYGTEKILAKYPHIQICFFSPPVKRIGNNNENSSDTTPNIDGKYIKDFCDAMKSVADEYHLPYFDHYDNMGINEYNWMTYYRDGTHLTYDKGADMFGAKVSSEIESLIN